MVASKLRLGDEVRVVAPSRNLTEVRQDVHHHAVDFWRKEGFTGRVQPSIIKSLLKVFLLMFSPR